MLVVYKNYKPTLVVFDISNSVDSHFFPKRINFPIPVIQHELLCHNDYIHDKKEEKLILLIHDWRMKEANDWELQNGYCLKKVLLIVIEEVWKEKSSNLRRDLFK
jgi:hypothetical protein